MLRRFFHPKTKISCSAVLIFNTPPNLTQQKSFIHEKLPRVRNYIADDNIEAAKSALVQLNVMVAQGMEPDAQMYTSLIQIMGRVRLEWQAFKLFSRMLEQGVKPLPETYLALKRATNPNRTRIIEQIEDKMAKMNSLLPEQLANVMKDAREKSERAADREMRELKNPETFSSSSSNENQKPISEKEKRQQEQKKAKAERVAELWGNNKTGGDDDQQMDIPKMGIDSIESVLAAVEQLECRNARLESIATGEQRENLSDKLNKLHEEELRIVLSIHKQLRTGSKQQLLNRILANVPAAYLESMFERRRHYFDSVKQVLELQIEELKEIEEQKKAEQHQQEDESEDKKAISNAIQSRSEMKNQLAQKEDAEYSTTRKVSPKNAVELTPQERFNMSPGFLEAPWGLLRRPMKQPANPSTPNPERDERSALTQQELSELQNTLLISGSLEQVPSLMLRRYCRHFHLKWSRKAGPKALQDLVEWHLRTFKPAGPNDQQQEEKVSEALDAQHEEERAQQQTLDQYNALVAVARITNNMKLIDDAEVSKVVLERQHRERLDRKRTNKTVEMENWQRRKQEIDQNMRRMPFVNLQKSLQEDQQMLQLDSAEGKSNQKRSSAPSSSQVLGASSSSSSSSPSSSNNNNSDSFDDHLISSSVVAEKRQAEFKRATKGDLLWSSQPTQQQQNIQELPPWEASAGSSATRSPFNLKTGRFDFGVPRAEYYEDSTGRYRVRQPQSLKQRFSVDESLLPAHQQERIRKERLLDEERQQQDEEDKELNRGKHHWRAKSFRSFLEKQKAKEKMEKEEMGTPKPIGAPVRMGSKFRRNASPPILHRKPRVNPERVDEE